MEMQGGKANNRQKEGCKSGNEKCVSEIKCDFSGVGEGHYQCK